MKRVLTGFGAAMIGAVLAACSSGADEASSAGSTMRVQGTVSQQLAVDNARAVAVGSDGRTVWTYLDGDRDFSLKLPLGQSYRIFIANQLSSGGQSVVARLVLDGADGRTEWLGANRGGVVSLGTLRPGPGAERSLQPTCSDCEGSDEETKDESTHEDDLECTASDESPFDDEKDGTCASCDEPSSEDVDESGGKVSSKAGEDDEKSCSLCKADDEVEVKASKSPRGCEDKQKDQHVGKKGAAPVKPCADKGKRGAKEPGKSDSKPSDQGKEGAAGDDEGGGEKNGKGADESKPSGGGSKGEGSSCKTTTECSSACACVASKCSVK